MDDDFIDDVVTDVIGDYVIDDSIIDDVINDAIDDDVIYVIHADVIDNDDYVIGDAIFTNWT